MGDGVTNVRMIGDVTIHFPLRSKRYPFKVASYPYPFCGLTHQGAEYAWTETECNCRRCKRVADLEKTLPKGQIGMDLL